MRKINKCLVVSGVLAALAGCGEDSYTPPDNSAANAPEHGGNISVSLGEKGAVTTVHLLGGVDGTSNQTTTTGEAFDRDGDYLTVTSMTSNLDDLTGFEVSGLTIVVRPSLLVDELVTGETRSAVFTYEISDGNSSVTRTATINVAGEDFAPVADGNFVQGFTKDSSASIDLLTRVTDADGEMLTISNVVADAGNPLNLPFTLTDNMLDLDIAAIADDIADGQLLSFNFTYDIADQRFTISRNLTVNILGVLEVPGAPFTQSYFISETIDETSAERDENGDLLDASPAPLVVIDLIQDVVDNEGDAIEVYDFEVDGVAGLVPGLTLTGNDLTVFPHAFSNDVAAGASRDYVVTYKMRDTNNNISDGRRTLTLTVVGKETNLLTINGFTNGDFESAPGTDNVGPNGWSPGFFVWGCPVTNIQASSARSGDYGLRMEGDFCDYSVAGTNFIPVLAANERYLYSYWIRSETAGSNDNPYLVFLGSTTTGFFNPFSSRLQNTSTNVWREDHRIIDATEHGFYAADLGAINLRFSIYAGTVGGGRDIDDMSLIKLNDYDLPSRNLLVEPGTFENDEVIVSNAGTAEIRNVDGDNKLFIDTTGSTAGPVLTIPLMKGSVVPGARYVVSLDIEYINNTTGGTAVSAGLSNGTEQISNSKTLRPAAAATGNNEQQVDILLTEENNRTAVVDWSQEENMSLNISLAQANSQFYINNIRVYSIP